MCGIAGIVNLVGGSVSKQKIEEGISCLRHRGPESEGSWINHSASVALGHRRLSIIDPGPLAAQPFHYLDRFSIVHNGELYNYIELKKILQQQGYTFTTSSDTEVIVAAYAHFGEKCLQHFDGMFAFAIWDETSQNLFAARDRFGEKPFFFFYQEGHLAFASEMKTLWSMGVPKEVNRSMLYNFLTIGYTSNPTDPRESFYNRINKLPAASFLNFNLPRNELAIEKYWTVNPDMDESISENEAIEKFRTLFQSSIQKRLRADVSIGTSLSGGLDSSSIVAICNEMAADNYSHKCFTASFPGFEKDELHFANTVATRFGLQHYLVEIDEKNIVQLMEEVMHYQEEPFTSASVLAQYEVCRSAKQHGVTVLLDGQGADETIGGYHKYYRWLWTELFRKKKLNASKELQSARALGVNESFSMREKMASRFPEFAAGILQTIKTREAFHHPDLDRGFAFSNKRNLYYSLPSSFDLNGALYFNSFVSGLEELLRLADRNSMAHAVEMRLPFLQHELVDFLFSLPSHFKIHEGWTKWILRKSVENKLPHEIAWRKDKLGFEPPQKKWMEQKDVQESIREAKKKLVGMEILNKVALSKKIKPHTSYAANNADWKYWSAAFLFD